MRDDFTISLIIPCYNEEKNIQKGVLDRIGNFTKNNPLFLEVVIVDDGSSDSSKTTIKERYLKTYPKFRLIENNHQGKAFALITGIKKASGPYILFSDIDLATPLEESEKLIAQVGKGYEIVIGSRNKVRQGAPLARKLMAVGFVLIRNLLIGLRDINDTQCGFKLFNKIVALKIIKKLKVFSDAKCVKSSSVSAGFDLEFLFIASKLGYQIKEIPVMWRHVETKNVNFLNDSLETLKDILKIKYFDLVGKYK